LTAVANKRQNKGLNETIKEQQELINKLIEELKTKECFSNVETSY
jgi:hypothetical protein